MAQSLLQNLKTENLNLKRGVKQENDNLKSENENLKIEISVLDDEKNKLQKELIESQQKNDVIMEVANKERLKLEKEIADLKEI